MTEFETTFKVRKLKFIMQLILKSIDHCNVNLLTITPMLQHTGMEVFEHSSQCRISGTLKIPDTRYPIFLKIVQYEPDTDTITALIITIHSIHTS